MRYSNGGSSTAAQYNPFRYRGYYRDSETGFYYLNSRYYDPNTGRFINADVYTSTGQGLIGNNMYAYCRNNPVLRVDISGQIDMNCIDDDVEDHLFPQNDIDSMAGGPVQNGTQINYPPNNGFQGPTARTTLPKGTIIQRFGDAFGKYVAPAGTAPGKLSLPPDKIGLSPTYYEVTKPITVTAGIVAPWFGQPGGGIQYVLDMSINDLLGSSALCKINLS